MNELIIAAQQALAALHNSQSYVEVDWVKNQCNRSITALSSALAAAKLVKTQDAQLN